MSTSKQKIILKFKNNDAIFDYEQYQKNLSKYIKDLHENLKSDVNTSFDIFESDQHLKDRKLCTITNQRQQLRGHIIQEAIGSYNKFENLNQGHPSGLDVISTERKIIMEIKNRTNTDNSSSRKTNLDKLAKYKLEHPEYMCVYGTVNPDTKSEFFSKTHKIIDHNGIKIYHYIGKELMELVFGDRFLEIIEFIKNELIKY